jgi:hypothetical protein
MIGVYSVKKYQDAPVLPGFCLQFAYCQAPGEASLQAVQANPGPAPRPTHPPPRQRPRVASRCAQLRHRGTSEFNLSEMAGDASEAALFRPLLELQFPPRKPNARLQPQVG